ncbi:hypothetical protein AX762_02900 [Alkalibacterium sp. 20]|nr:hypothetical protein AX762_02900 [Alkalibacterium sp. 20]
MDQIGTRSAPARTSNSFLYFFYVVGRISQLITKERYAEAYDSIAQSEGLSFQQPIIEELADMKRTIVNQK